MKRLVLKTLKYLLLAVFAAVIIGLTWLRWESHKPRQDWWDERQGQLVGVATESGTTPFGQRTDSVTLKSDSGLQVFARVVRDKFPNGRLPVLVVLGGHRTGSDAVDLFGDVGDRVVVGVDYPYMGPEKVRGARQILSTLPLASRAFLETVPAVSLVLDWVTEQPWADTDPR